MASITRIRTALADVLKANVPKLQVYPRLADAVQAGDGGVLVVGSPTWAIDAMRKGLITYTFPLNVLAPLGDMAIAVALLDVLAAPTGEGSITQVIWDHGRAAVGGLGVLDADGEVDVDAHVDSLPLNDVTFPNAGIDHIGAVLNCIVHTSGEA